MELRTDAFTDPKTNLEHAGVGIGMRVVDLGAGSGHYSFAAGELVGEDGRVYAVEVQKDLVLRIKNEARARGLMNVEVLWGDIEEPKGTKLGDRVADCVIISNTLFQVEDKTGTLKEAHRILKPEGTLLIIDWNDSFGGMGPDPSHVLAEADARIFVEKAGFRCDNSFVAGAHHYGIIATRT